MANETKIPNLGEVKGQITAGVTAGIAPVKSAIGNTATSQLASKASADGPQFVDGSRWVWSSTGPANGGTVVAASGGGYWNREFSNRVDSRWFVTPDTGADVRVALQAFIDFCCIHKLAGVLRTGVYLVSADPASASQSVCIALRDNLHLTIEPGALIKGVNGLSSWARIVTGNNVVNVRIIGTLMVDGNVANISATNNEHMHGVILYNGEYNIDAIDARNCRGDNVFLGGDNGTASKVTIGRIYAEKAGRKNLVLGVTKATIGYAELDNLAGGAQAYGGTGDDTDGHSLDVEPDTYAGEPLLSTIGTLFMRGSGADMSSLNTSLLGRNYVLNIGSLDATITQRTGVPAWIQYGITCKIGKGTIRGLTLADSMIIRYLGAAFIADDLTIEGAVPGMMMQVQAGTEGRPMLTAQTLRLTNTHASGSAMQLDGANANIQRLALKQAVVNPLFIRETLNASAAVGVQTVNIGVLSATECSGNGGSDFIAQLHTVAAQSPNVTIRHLEVNDARAVTLPTQVILGVGSGGDWLTVSSSAVPVGMKSVGFTASIWRYRESERVHVVSGAAPTHPAQSGTLALRSDGGTGTTSYVREGPNWVAK